MKWLSFAFALSLLAGCGFQHPPAPENPSFIINQVEGPTRTSFNGAVIRTRVYQGVHNYGNDNVTIFVTDEDGKTQIFNTK